MTEKHRSAEHYYAEQPRSEAKFGLVRTQLRGKTFEFITASGVFSTKRVDLGTRVLIESMILPDQGCVLDVGCGYGAVGIVAASSNPKLHVTLTDVNRRAVLLARQNVEKNNVPNAQVKQGSLYEPVEGLVFHCVLSNPPVSAGMKTIEAMIRGAPAVMAFKATFQMVIQSKIGKKTLPALFCEAFGNFRVLARESGYRVLIAEKR
ncbi:MAG TPA: methyltransferase [Candidatus Bathyarchaeia archaeon]|nr:methyltransferase [Candidatus Bathyarchaeia archaeon]